MAASGRAVFLGIARDCESFLPRVLANLEQFAATFRDPAFVFATSDCRDNSYKVLSKWLSNRHVGIVLELGELETQHPVRTVRLAAARNACLRTIRMGPWCSFEFLVVVDLDNVLATEDFVPGFAAAVKQLQNAPDWAGVFANADDRYFDIWALRHETWCPYDCWHRIWQRSPGQLFQETKIREVHARQIRIPATLPPIEVKSAFGGLGIYKQHFAKLANYDGLDAEGLPVCEHVAFNSAVVDAGGRLFVLPSLLVRAPPEHLFQGDKLAMRWQLKMEAVWKAQNRQRKLRELLGLKSVQF